jgi:small redox-active disulfide protein 2
MENTQTAVRELGVDCDVTKVSDIQEIIQFNVMLTPALAIDGVVKSSGKVLSVDELKEILSK